MNDKLLSKLTKRDILKLSGFTNRKAPINELKTQLNNRLVSININRRGARTIDYIKAFKQADNELFNKISHDKSNKQQHKLQRKQLSNQSKNQRLMKGLYSIYLFFYIIHRKLKLEHNMRRE